MQNKIISWLLLLSFPVTLLSAAETTKETDPFPLFFLQRNLTVILVNDNIVPPVAARDYVYPQLAANYILSAGEGRSKINQRISHFPVIDASIFRENFSRSLAASVAFATVAEKLIYTSQPFVDSFAVLLDWYRRQGMTPQIFARSQKIGQRVAAEIIAWMDKDGFNETRRMNKYVLLKTPGKWEPTPPGYFAAIEPHWGKIRPLLLTHTGNLDKLLPLSFDTAAASNFYHEAKNVYEVSKNLTIEQRSVAAFWDCNPFALKRAGHINTIIKKISPGGHWMNITGLACRAKKLGLQQTCETYTLCAIAIFDSFIYTWDKKYQYNYVRPETFIEQMGIDFNWQPFIQSPPFPEFPSGHAVISNAAAVVLTSIFGKDFSFTDVTETEFGLPERKFASFQAAADEATISRVYGGIHFLFSCRIGQEIGKMIGQQQIKTLIL
jgi:hypothetical protein